MNAPVIPHSLLQSAAVEPERAGAILADAIAGADDGELFLERSESRRSCSTTAG
jgi:TldD protein